MMQRRNEHTGWGGERHSGVRRWMKNYNTVPLGQNLFLSLGIWLYPKCIKNAYEEWVSLITVSIPTVAA